ncbi:MAG: DUF1576 domain-containing protein, partial [Clostridiales bacterium]|nr:DUF1576 domain-containing protein [Clostridiales bacterium]
VLYPTILAIARLRKPIIQEDEYLDIFKEDTPLSVVPQNLPEEEAPSEPPL